MKQVHKFDPARAGLVLAGGGARGAYQAGVLKGIMEIYDKPNNPFGVITGVSVGAINAAAFASRTEDVHQGVLWLEEMWSNLRSNEIYKTDFYSLSSSYSRWFLSLVLSRAGIPIPNSLFDSEPLANLLEKKIDYKKLEKAFTKKHLEALAITASSYGDGSAKTFFQSCTDHKNWSRARRKGIRTTLGTDHILASSALPILFPAQIIDGEYFGDGGLRLTVPLSPAIRLGARKLLVIETRDDKLDTPQIPMDEPEFGRIVGYLMDVLFNDYLEADVQRALRINQTINLIPETQRKHTNLEHIDTHIISPSKDIRELTETYAHTLPWTVRSLMKKIGAWGGDWRVPSYLLFEPAFINALMEIGYIDAMSQRDELQEFFAEE